MQVSELIWKLSLVDPELEVKIGNTKTKVQTLIVDVKPSSKPGVPATVMIYDAREDYATKRKRKYYNKG